MKFNNAFLQKNGYVGMQFDVKGFKEPISVWKDDEGIHSSEQFPGDIRAAAVLKYISTLPRFSTN